MSVATSFKYYRPFPFCTDDATAPAGDVDFIVLNETSGDEGLAEAMRLWWVMEDVALRPTGTLDDGGSGFVLGENGGGLVDNWGFQSGDTAPVFSFTSTGVFSNGASTSGAPANQPRERVCTSTRTILLCSAVYGRPEYRATGQILFSLAYVSSRWRLYYSFLFDYQNSGATVLIRIQNPARAPATPDGTGTFLFAGYTLDLEYVLFNGATVTVGPSILGQTADAPDCASFYTF
jgi:hypothetical protein